MDIQHYLDLMKTIQTNLLDFIEKEHNVEESYMNLMEILEDEKIRNNPQKLKSLLYLILMVSKNHFRGSNFNNKIEKIIKNFSNEIKQTLSNFEIFKLFKNNKRILPFLFDNEIIVMNETITEIILSEKYKQANYREFFLKEIKPFIPKQLFEIISQDIPDKYEEKRQIGENENHLCELIRNDLIDDFISYVNLNNVFLKQKVEKSIFETNPFLIKNEPTLIEYAAFFGSTQIFKYLYLNGVDLCPSLWKYVVHSENPEIVHILEEKKVELNNVTFEKCVKESIKCHHNDVANYFLNNLKDILTNEEEEEELYFDFIDAYFKYYNYAFIDINHINKSQFNIMCKYDYFIPVKILLESNKIDVNDRIPISKSIIYLYNSNTMYFLFSFYFISFYKKVYFAFTSGVEILIIIQFQVIF